MKILFVTLLWCLLLLLNMNSAHYGILESQSQLKGHSEYEYFS